MDISWIKEINQVLDKKGFDLFFINKVATILYSPLISAFGQEPIEARFIKGNGKVFCWR